MNFKTIFRLFSLGLIIILFSAASFAGSDAVNILNRIEIEKPYDNHYQLNLYFTERFQDNAFLQELGSGSFQVFIPDTKPASKKIKIIHKDKVHKSDVKIEFDNTSYAKDKPAPKYLKLTVNTPVNSDIELTAHTEAAPAPVHAERSYMNIFSIISAALLVIIAVLLASIFKAVRSMHPVSKNYTAFPASFLNSPDTYTRETNGNVSYEKPEAKLEINPSSESDEFDGFDLAMFHELPQEEAEEKADSAVSNPITAEPLKTEPAEEKEEVSDEIKEEDTDAAVSEKDDNSGLIELISELKIGSDRGFYLTTADNGAYALFGYAGGNVFLLQKFDNLSQENIQAKFYNKKDSGDLYIVKLDSYRAMVSVSDTEIKELAVL